METKAISNEKGDADDNIQDNAATNIISDVIGIDGHYNRSKGGTFNNQQGREVVTEVRRGGAGG